VDPAGWAHFEYVRLPEYRWGIFLADPVHDRRIGFGDFAGQPVWQEVPGEFRNQLRRLIVTQGDTEPASVEQQRWLGQRCPSMYDLRNLFQVNVEEGRHLWAMVYLLHSYFGRDGRDEAEELLARQSGNRDKPRILDAFNEPIENWLDSSCSRCSPIAMGSRSCCRFPKARWIRLAHDALHADGKKPTTCSWVKPAWPESSSAPVSC
jgi:benzoyl-CoA 2,3-dioxygenase component B